MKNQEGFKTNNNGQGQSTSNRAFVDQNEKLKEKASVIQAGNVRIKHPIKKQCISLNIKKVNNKMPPETEAFCLMMQGVCTAVKKRCVRFIDFRTLP